MALMVGACGSSTPQAARAELDPTPTDGTASPGDVADASGVGSCAGTYEGTYAGGDEGIFAAVVDPTGNYRQTFSSSGAGLSIEGFGTVDADGTMAGELSSGATATGVLDSNECSAEGMWENDPLGISGTWQMERASESITPARRFAGCEPGSGPDLREAVLIRPDLTGRDLSCADFALVELAQPDFTDAVLDGALLRGADLEEPVFSGTSLVGADLRGAVLTRALFVGADLRNADLQVLAVDDITFVDTICPDGTNSDDSEDGACGVTAVSEP